MCSSVFCSHIMAIPRKAEWPKLWADDAKTNYISAVSEISVTEVHSRA